MSLTGNKGEWSELLVFFSLLEKGVLFSADENLQRIESIYYEIIKAIREQKDYIRKFDFIRIIEDENVTDIPIKNITDRLPIMLEKIREGQKSIPEVKMLLEDFKISTLKASSGSKGDLKLQIYDNRTGGTPELDFSIKSFIGAKPTLLNASGATVFYYRAANCLPQEFYGEVNAINTRTKLKDRLNHLQNNDVSLVFDKISSSTFTENLYLIDYRMPEILANLYLCSYYSTSKKLNDVVEYYCEKYKESKRLIEYKVKEMLVATALGMVPDTPWTGLDEATGGYIVVKDNGEILCYHIYDRNKLKNYLYTHTAFDSPSSSRTGAGQFHEINGEQIFKLTLQIRFA